jgi:hypothetical protein
VNGSFLCVVEWHLGEEVVTDMGVDNVVEGVVEDRSKGAINSAECTTEPIPFFATEVRHEDISVLQESDQHEVVVHDHVGDEVIGRNIQEAWGSRETM